MNAPVIPLPTLNDLVQIAVENDAIGQIGAAPSVAAARQIAAKAVVDALDTWEFDAGIRVTLPPPMLVVAMLDVLAQGWAAREAGFERAVAEARLEGVE